jgi:hypothetical protein
LKTKSIEDITEAQFLELVKKICTLYYKSDREHNKAVFDFEHLSEHPEGSDLIYHPKKLADTSPDGIVKTVKDWRSANGKLGFKSDDQ